MTTHEPILLFDHRPSDAQRVIATLVCTRNPSLKRLDQVLKSIRAEIPGDIIMVDDGSTTIDVEHISTLVDVFLRNTRNLGVPDAANAGLDYLDRQGYSICFRSDDDDLTLTGRFADTLKKFEDDSSCVLVGGMSNDAAPDGRIIRVYGRSCRIEPGNKRLLYPSIPARHSTFALHLSRLNGRLRYDSRFPFGQDYSLLFRATECGTLMVSDRIYVEYLTGPTTRSFKHRRSQLLHRLKNYGLNGDWRLSAHYLAIGLSLISFAVPESIRPHAWRIYDSLQRRSPRR